MDDDGRVRVSCRALLVDDDDRVLLVEHDIGDDADVGDDAPATVWVGPGGGVEAGETLVEALARELWEEAGHQLDPAGVHEVWTRYTDAPGLVPSGWTASRTHIFLVRTTAFEPASGVGADEPGHPDQEGILALRWWTPGELGAAGPDVLFSPRALPRLLVDLLADEAAGRLPERPLDVGI